MKPGEKKKLFRLFRTRRVDISFCLDMQRYKSLLFIKGSDSFFSFHSRQGLNFAQQQPSVRFHVYLFFQHQKQYLETVFVLFRKFDTFKVQEKVDRKDVRVSFTSFHSGCEWKRQISCDYSHHRREKFAETEFTPSQAQERKNLDLFRLKRCKKLMTPNLFFLPLNSQTLESERWIDCFFFIITTCDLTHIPSNINILLNKFFQCITIRLRTLIVIFSLFLIISKFVPNQKVINILL